MSKLDIIKNKLEKKEPVLGVLVSMNDCSVSEMLGVAGCDFLWLDVEHSALDKRDIMLHVMAADTTNAATFIRVPWNDPILVKPILEMGVDGIIFPCIRTVEDAKLAVSSCEYPPKGTRGFGPKRVSYKYRNMSDLEYIQKAGSDIWKILQVEHIDCVNNLEEIVAVEGVDALLLGPNDLSGSIGLLGQSDHPEVQKLIDKACEVAVKAGKPIGVFSGDQPDSIKKWMSKGISWFTVGGDSGYIMGGARKSLKLVKDAFLGEQDI